MNNLNKRLCRKLGLCWHEPKYDYDELGLTCSCGEEFHLTDDGIDSIEYHCNHLNPDFTTPSGIVLLIEKMMEREDWQKFARYLWGGFDGPDVFPRVISIDLITDKTGKFAKLCDEWLPEVKGE